MGKRLSLRKKTLLILGITILSLIGILYALSRVVLMSSFERLEQHNMQRNVARVLDALSADISGLDSLVEDWSAWDDTYAFVAGEDDEYISANLVAETFEILHLNLISYTSCDGEPVYQKTYDLPGQAAGALTGRLGAHPTGKQLLACAAGTETYIAGIVNLPPGPVLISARPILTSQSGGPPRGTLLFGRLLDAAEIQQLADVTHVSVILLEGAGPELDWEWVLSAPQPLIQPLNSDLVAGYQRVDDIFGEPAFVLQVEMPREIYLQGKSSLSFFLALLFASGLVFCAAAFLLLENQVLSPLSRLSAGVHHVGASGDHTARLPVSGEDELAHLTRDINAMLAALERSEKELRDTERRNILRASPDLLLVVNRQGQCLYCHSGWADGGLLPAGQIAGKSLEHLELLQDGARERAIESIRAALNTRALQVFEFTHAGEKQRYFEARVVALNETETLLIARDITDQKQAQEALRRSQAELEERVHQRTAELAASRDQLTRLNQELQTEIAERRRAEARLLHDAFHDTLTGLPNRALFLDRLGRAIERHNRLPHPQYAVLFIDLDHFKVINDSLGHNTGDQLLISIAGRLAHCLRAMDTAARLGGDEFVILLEDIHDLSGVLRVAERIQNELKQPFFLSDRQVYTTASIGIVLGSTGYQGAADILRDADIALYRAKALGKDRYEIFDLPLRMHAIARLELESDLRQAMEQQEFILHYQPIRDLHSRRITGFEALLRWRSPRRGLLLPAEFIQVAEESGLIIPIGEWVLRQACAQMHRWHARFPSMPQLSLNVNISGRQFAQPHLVDQIEQILQETGLTPHSLKLEITESVFLESVGRARGTLDSLGRLGVGLQIDDFGTGYSSLAYLHHFPIHTIKIDRSFVQRIGGQEDSTDLIRTFVSLARDLGMSAVAEGVETEEQLSLLQKLDCQYAQGYLFARPMDCQGIEDLLLQLSLEHPKDTTEI